MAQHSSCFLDHRDPQILTVLPLQHVSCIQEKLDKGMKTPIYKHPSTSHSSKTRSLFWVDFVAECTSLAQVHVTPLGPK